MMISHISVGIDDDKYGKVKILNLNKANKIKSIPVHSAFIYCIDLLSNGNLLPG